MKLITILTLILITINTTVHAFTVDYLCQAYNGDIDIYSHEFTTETPYEVEVELYEQCKDIGRLFVGYPEK